MHSARAPRAVVIAAIAAALVGGCGRSTEHHAPAGSASVPRDVVDPSGATVSVPTPIPAKTRQLVVGITADWEQTAVRLALFEREGDTAPWVVVGTWFPGTVGRAGTAWGRGLHGAGAPVGRGRGSAAQKREGDGRAPAGVFLIGGAFGYSSTPPITKMGYTTMTASYRCIDDSSSRLYNQIVNESKVTPDWSSAESMRRDDPLYELGMVIDHNGTAVPGQGSCIFFHVGSGQGGGTAGCTSMAKPDIERLVERLDPLSRPVYVLLPQAQYDLLSSEWNLPPHP